MHILFRANFLTQSFPAYVMTYTTVVGGGMMDEESKPSVLNPVCIS